MPPVSRPVTDWFDMVTMTIAPTLPSMGSSDPRIPMPPSFGCSSGGAWTGSLPEGTRGGARRGPVMLSLRRCCLYLAGG